MTTVACCGDSLDMMYIASFMLYVSSSGVEVYEGLR